MSYSAKGLLIVSFSIIFLSAATACQAAQKDRQVRTVLSPQSSATIPVAEIATRAVELSIFLRTLDSGFAHSRDIQKIQRELPEVSDRMTMEFRRAMRILQSQPTIEMLQTQQQVWQKRQVELTRWLNPLTLRANQLETALSQVTTIQKRWNRTLESALAAQAPEAVVQQIHAVLPAIEEAKTTLQTERMALRDLQGRVADKAAQSRVVLDGILQAQQSVVGGLLRREGQPIWSPDLWVRVHGERLAGFYKIALEPWTDIKQYLHDPAGGIPIHLLFFIGFSLLSFAMRTQVRRWPADEGLAVIATVTDHSLASALVATLIFASSPYSPAPPTVRDLFDVFALAAMIRLMRSAVDHRVVFGLYGLVFLFGLDTLRQAFAGAALFDQTIVLLEALIGITVLTWSLIYGSLQRSFADKTGSTRLDRFRVGAGLVLVILGVGLVAGVLGYLRMARLLVSSVLIGGASALTLSACIRIMDAVTAFGLRVRPLSLLWMVRRYRNLLEHRTHLFLVWLAIGGWSIRVLDYVGMSQPVLSLGKAVLSAKLERGSIRISLGDLFAFALTLWAAYLLSVFIRFMLQEDVYPRRKVSQGIAYAVSRLIHYLIIAVGFVVGIGMLGMDLTKVTVLVSAFGVGIGFGLQSVVNNFVSGLILLFERPIHQGDTIEVGNLMGKVLRIGIRASIVRTGQGAEIIVPNSELVSKQMTNWTFSDQLRRIDLPVGVNYDAEPEKVIEVIEAAAAAHPKVLRNPQPRGLFVGFGESSINFELRAWTDGFIGWREVKSELAIAVYDAVRKAGFSFPFPQREVRLLREPIKSKVYPYPENVK